MISHEDVSVRVGPSQASSSNLHLGVITSAVQPLAGPARFERLLHSIAREYEVLLHENEALKRDDPAQATPKEQIARAGTTSEKRLAFHGLGLPEAGENGHAAQKSPGHKVVLAEGGGDGNGLEEKDRGETFNTDELAVHGKQNSQQNSLASSGSRPRLVRSDSRTSGGSDNNRELFETFFNKVQRSTGKKGLISARRVIELLNEAKVATPWQPSDVHELFNVLDLFGSRSSLLLGVNGKDGKKEVPFRLFRNAVLNPNPKWGEPAMKALMALREAAVSEDAMDVIMSVMSVTKLDEAFDNELKPGEKLLDAIMTVVIIANSISLGIFATEDRGDSWGLSQSIDCVFTILFLIEILLKIWMRSLWSFVAGPEWRWNAFDSLIVVLGILDIFLTLLFSLGDINTSTAMSLKMIRLLRLARLARVYRVSLFRELKLMVNGMLGLLRTLSCTFVVLFLAVYFFGILLVQVLGSPSKPDEDVPGQKILFSNVPRSMYTVFRCLVIDDCVAIDGTPISLHISESVGWAFDIGYCAACILMNYGLGSLITALVVDSTLNAAKTAEFRRDNQDDEKRRLAQKIHVLAEKFQRAQWGRCLSMTDVGQNALFINKDLFMEVCRQKDVKAILDEIDVDERDRADLFEAIDADGNGRIELGELVEGIMRMRGTVRKADIVATRLTTASLLEKVDMLEHTMAEGMIFLESQMAQLLTGASPLEVGQAGGVAGKGEQMRSSERLQAAGLRVASGNSSRHIVAPLVDFQLGSTMDV